MHICKYVCVCVMYIDQIRCSTRFTFIIFTLRTLLFLRSTFPLSLNNSRTHTHTYIILENKMNKYLLHNIFVLYNTFI